MRPEPARYPLTNSLESLMTTWRVLLGGSNLVICLGRQMPMKQRPLTRENVVIPTTPWRRWDSNPRPPACKAGALPAELRPRHVKREWHLVFLPRCYVEARLSRTPACCPSGWNHIARPRASDSEPAHPGSNLSGGYAGVKKARERRGSSKVPVTSGATASGDQAAGRGLRLLSSDPTDAAIDAPRRAPQTRPRPRCRPRRIEASSNRQASIHRVGVRRRHHRGGRLPRSPAPRALESRRGPTRPEKDDDDDD